MEHFNFERPADVFVGNKGLRRRGPVKYLRFSSGAEAIRYAIETVSRDLLSATAIETDDGRFSGSAIRALYDQADYPFPRRLQLT